MSLRLYVEDETTSDDPVVFPPTNLDQLRESFEQATGWSFLQVKKGEPVPQTAVWRHEIQGRLHDQCSTMALAERSTKGQQVSPEIAAKLADGIVQLLDRMHAAETALWQREAQLASAIPLVVRPHEEDRQLARRLESVLRCAADAVGAQSAALYVLDDDTRYLKLRSHWGLSDERFVDSPRRLRGSKGDLEALTGHAVVLEKPDRCAAWDIPQAAASAICVPVSTAEVPLGTMWIFGAEPRQYSDSEVNLIEVVAGRLAAELEREILLRERLLASTDRDSSEVTTWQKHQWDCAIPKLDHWQVSASPSAQGTMHGDVLSTHWHDENRMGITIAAADRAGVCGALAAASFLAAENSHRQTVSPSRRLTRINETVSALSAGDQMLNTLCGMVDLKSGKVQFSLAGDVDAFVIRSYSWEQVSGSCDDKSQAVGVSGDSKYRIMKTHLAPGDTLMVLAGQKRNSSAQPAIPRADGLYMAEALLRHNHLTSQQMVDYLVALATREATVWHGVPATLVWRRMD